VALSADGNTALVGGFSDNGGVGAAWVFTRSGGVWTQQTKLVGSGGVGNSQQGQSVALSADGNTALIGGYLDNGNNGAAWVFTRSGTTWSQQGSKLVGSGNTGAANQGASVALSADGNTAILGGYGDNASEGATWVFTRTAGVWSQQGSKLVGSGGVGAQNQGSSVSLSADGTIALVGGFADNGNNGASWEFKSIGGVWAQQGNKLVGSGAVGHAEQGSSVSISGDGNTALAGGFADNSGAGAAWVFVNASPTIVSINDVPNDQGGKVNLRWTASSLDNAPGNPIDSYTIWRQVPASAALAAVARGASWVGEGSGVTPGVRTALRTTVVGAQIYYWELVGSQIAHGFPGYSYTAATTADSVPGSNPYTLFMVETEKSSTGEYWQSDPDSGYSVDNLPPGPPAPVAAAYTSGATHLHWGANAEPDFAIYRVYRGATAGFVPGPGNRIASQPDTGFVDVGAAGSYYKISAVDIHGNESVFALITPAGTTGVGPVAPVALTLEGARPNPARGGDLRVSFALPSNAAARLEVFDTSGRRLVDREVGSFGAGWHLIDVSEGRRFAPGAYWIRLSQGVSQRTAPVAVIE
jgi:hypothetical protein